VQFSTPTPGNFVLAPSTASMGIGLSSSTFYTIDTLIAASHQLTVTDITHAGTWLPAISTYSVTSGPPAGLVWATPSRRLIAGTTLQFTPNYQSGLTTNTVAAVQLVDQFGNITTSSNTFFIQYTSNKNTTWMGIDPSAVIIATNPTSWTNIGPNPA